MFSSYIPRLNKVQEIRKHKDKWGRISTIGGKKKVLVEKLYGHRLLWRQLKSKNKRLLFNGNIISNVKSAKMSWLSSPERLLKEEESV